MNSQMSIKILSKDHEKWREPYSFEFFVERTYLSDFFSSNIYKREKPVRLKIVPTRQSLKTNHLKSEKK